MPHKPKHPCNHSGCPALTHQRFCPDHASQHAKQVDASRVERKGNTTERGYGAAWRKLRLAVLAAEPACRWPGCTRPATDVDHIKPKAAGGTDDPSNLQPLCSYHHKVKTARRDGAFGRAGSHAQKEQIT